MYPSLVHVDSVERVPEKPWHVVINADNYHALQLLLYGYEGAVDVIYIDPALQLRRPRLEIQQQLRTIARTCIATASGFR